MNDIIARIRENSRSFLTREDAPIGVKAHFGAKIVGKQGPNVREVGAFFTTDDVDAVGDVVIQQGVDWSEYDRRNRPLFTDHCYGVVDWIGSTRSGRSLKATSTGGEGWYGHAVVRLDRGEKAAAVISAAESGCLGFSIAFEPLDYGPLTADERKVYPNATGIIRRCRIIEVSATCMPCNSACMTMEVATDEAKATDIRRRLVASKTLPQIEARIRVPRKIVRIT